MSTIIFAIIFYIHYLLPLVVLFGTVAIYNSYQMYKVDQANPDAFVKTYRQIN